MLGKAEQISHRGSAVGFAGEQAGVEALDGGL